jgi:undecaprenyl-diphosphatase
MDLSNYLIVFAADYLIFSAVFAIPYLLLKHKRHDLVRIAATVLAAYALAEILKDLFSIPRPFVAGGFEPLIDIPPNDLHGSFPSGHVTLLSALGAATFYTERIAGRLLVALAMVVGLGRVLAGVHYLIDVAGGLLIGVAIAWMFELIHKKFAS